MPNCNFKNSLNETRMRNHERLHGLIRATQPLQMFYKCLQVRRGLNCLSQRIIGSNTLVQGALPAILKNTKDDFYQNTINTLFGHAKLVFGLLNKVEGLTPVMPQGAMYMMVCPCISSLSS